jgi:hypothetical protein
MWFYVPAVIMIVLFAWWVSRTNLYRHFRSRRLDDPGQQGSHRADGAAYWGGGGDVGGGGYDGGGGI